jgi:hypothetical protein
VVNDLGAVGGEPILENGGGANRGKTTPAPSGPASSLFFLKYLMKTSRNFTMYRVLMVDPLGMMCEYTRPLLSKKVSSICLVRLAWTLAFIRPGSLL